MEQTRGPMDKNRIGGVPHRTSGPMIAKSKSIKGAGRKFGGCARKAVEVLAIVSKTEATSWLEEMGE